MNPKETIWTAPDDLNPGVRRLCALLNESGFRTCDSGDGETHMAECDRGYPYASIRVRDANRMVSEARRLRLLMGAYSVLVGPLGVESTKPAIQAMFDPGDESAIIDLTGVVDKMLAPEVP